MSTDGKQSSLNRVALGQQIPASTNQTPSAVETSPALNRSPARLAGSAMFSLQAWEEIARSLKLSGRELQLARGVFDDEKDHNIASALGVSVHTIHTHFERLHHKLGITDRAQLLQRVMQEFLALTASPENVLPPICANRATGRCPLRL